MWLLHLTLLGSCVRGYRWYLDYISIGPRSLAAFVAGQLFTLLVRAGELTRDCDATALIQLTELRCAGLN
jgi:hypothetical protein